MLEILDSGTVNGEDSIRALVTRFDIQKAIVSEHAKLISHWWLIRQPGAEAVMYFGTLETFATWKQRFEQ